MPSGPAIRFRAVPPSIEVKLVCPSARLAAIPVVKGGELGAFEMGSTVILAFEPGRASLDARVAPGARLRVGEAIGGPG